MRLITPLEHRKVQCLSLFPSSEQCRVAWPPPLNGGLRAFDRKRIPGATTTFQCRFGYVINGPATVTCQEDRTWTEFPTCEPDPSNITNVP